jgi:ABC-2 type transport system ATP-binding protein
LSQDAVRISHLTKRFTPGFPPALDDVDETLPQGKLVGLVGPDGAGKTTLMRMMAGLMTPSEGSVSVLGYDTIKDQEYIHFLTGYMPQKFGLYEDLTAIQNLNLYAALSGIPKEQQKETFDRLLRFTGLEPFRDRLAGALSGGMKQKLGLACALMKKPQLLLLDEPSVGVDPISRRELWKMVRELLDEGISIIWSTSYLDEAERCDLVLLLNKGKVLYSGDPKELTNRVEGRVYTISGIQGSKRELLFHLLAQENVIDGVIQGKDIRIVTKEKEKIVADLDKNLKVEPVPPRFEDAFIDLLGGGPGGESKLAELTPSINQKDKTVIVADGLTKQFGNFTAADHVSFQVTRGEIFGLLGPNGAGKSTTFKMMCGLLKPTSGKAEVNHLDLQQAPSQARAHIGYMAQKFSLYNGLSVSQNLNFFSGIYNLKGRKKRDAVRKMVEIFSLQNYLDASPDELSLGYKQRLALACANMHHPEVLFLDEPTSGVDPITRRVFW